MKMIKNLLLIGLLSTLAPAALLTASALHRKKPFACENCPVRFSLKEKLTRHIATLHTTETDYACPKCNNTFFATDGALTKHLKGFHPELLEQHWSPKRFSNQTSFKYTLLPSPLVVSAPPEDPEKKFKCTICDISFSRLNILNRHTNALHASTTIPTSKRAKKNDTTLPEPTVDTAAAAPPAETTDLSFLDTLFTDVDERLPKTTAAAAPPKKEELEGDDSLGFETDLSLLDEWATLLTTRS